MSYIVIFEDVIIAVPFFAKERFAQELQKLNTVFWKGLKKSKKISLFSAITNKAANAISDLLS